MIKHRVFYDRIIANAFFDSLMIEANVHDVGLLQDGFKYIVAWIIRKPRLVLL